ncbi:NmrA family NAD(P)-binding protein [Labilithrix luteola]|nr:NmrA family NAD(P)-binding protein [Labilithrix luteola]
MFVIAGATGNTGSVVADTLLAQGKKVRVLVRDAAKGEAFRKRGADVFVLPSLDDEAGLTRALTGAEAAYILSPPDVASSSFLADRRKTFDVVKRAVDASGVGHVVLLSSIAAHRDHGTGPILSVAYAERVLRETKAKLTFVRASYFLENWAPVLAATADGKLPTFLPADLTIPMVATKDIGLVAAKALLEGPPSAKVDIIELAGAEDESPRTIAAHLSTILGKPLELDVAPLDAVVPVFTSFGVSVDAASLFREMYAGLQNGTVAFEGNGARFVRGSTGAEAVLRGLLGKG